MSDDTEIRPFSVRIPQADLDDLNDRLTRTRFPDDLPDLGWGRGVPTGYLKGLVEYWRTTYNWRRHEAEINTFPQFTTEIDGANVHFLHVRSPEPDALALLITHGWPGSVVEFLDLIGPLADPRSHGGDPADAFHLVVPSIPGFGFSGPTPDADWGIPRVSRVFATLMGRLGYDHYGTQGGDVGSFVSPELGRIDPDRVVGIHTNGLVTYPPGDPAALADLSEAELARLDHLSARDFSFAVVMGNKPQTLAFGLTDSPAGQLAWIVEKFGEWTDPAKELPEEAVDRDRILTNVMLYWLTGTAGSSMHLFYEVMHPGGGGTPKPRSTTPLGVAVFPGDVSIRRFAERENTVVHWSEFDRGGHFAAMEAPDLLVDDVRLFFRDLR